MVLTDAADVAVCGRKEEGAVRCAKEAQVAGSSSSVGP